MEFAYLVDHVTAMPTVAQWYFDEWGYLTEGNTIEKVAQKLECYLHRDKIPLMIVGIDDGEIVAAARLKYYEMDIYRTREHWIGGVYVTERYRDNNVAAEMVVKLISIARDLGVERLHLQTENKTGGLYHRLGWQPLEQVNYHGVDVLVMEYPVQSSAQI